MIYKNYDKRELSQKKDSSFLCIGTLFHSRVLRYFVLSSVILSIFNSDKSQNKVSEGDYIYGNA